MSDNKRQENAKEFILHLRSIHFFLLVTCFSILVVSVMSRQKSQLTLASKQIDKIASVINSWEKHSDWLTDYIEETLKEEKKKRSEVYYNCMKFKNWPVDSSLSLPKSQTIPIGKQWMVIGDKKRVEKLVFSFLDESGAIERPATLSGFIEIFRAILRGGEIKLLKEVQPKGIVVSDSGRGKFGVELIYSSTFKERKKPRSPFSSRSWWEDGLSLTKVSEDLGSILKAQIGFSLSTNTFVFVPPNVSIKPVRKKFEILIPASLHEKPIELDVYGAFKKEFEIDWDLKPYDELFRELNEMSQKYLDWRFDNAYEIIKEKCSKKENNQLEIWGAKIPAREISRWGTLIIFVIQLYLLLHFSSFTSCVEKKIEPLDVPWIGLYSGSFSKTVFLVLGFLFPTGVLALLVENLFQYQKSGSESTWLFSVAFMLFLFSLFITGATIRKVFHFWRMMREIEKIGSGEVLPAEKNDDKM